MTAQDQLIEFQSEQIKALQSENANLRKYLAEAKEVLISIINEIEVTEPETVKP